APVAFCRPQRFRMRDAIAARPCLVVESVAVDDQGVAFPAADRIALKARSRIGLQLTAVRVDQAIGEVIVQNGDDRRCLEDAFPARKSFRLRPARQTLIEGSRLVVLLLTLYDEVADPWLQGRGIGTGDDIGPFPHA